MLVRLGAGVGVRRRAFVVPAALCGGPGALIDATRHALAARPRVRRALLAGTAFVLVAANLLLAVEFRLDLATTGRRATWHDLGARRVTFLVDRLRSRQF
jgi:hypothetical protein